MKKGFWWAILSVIIFFGVAGLVYWDYHTSMFEPLAEEEGRQRLHARDSEREAREIPAPFPLLRARERTVVGGDCVYGAVREAAPERLAVRVPPERRAACRAEAVGSGVFLLR